LGLCLFLNSVFHLCVCWSIALVLASRGWLIGFQLRRNMSSYTVYIDAVDDRWSSCNRNLCVDNEGTYAAPAQSMSLFLSEGLDEEASQMPINSLCRSVGLQKAFFLHMYIITGMLYLVRSNAV